VKNTNDEAPHNKILSCFVLLLPLRPKYSPLKTTSISVSAPYCDRPSIIHTRNKQNYSFVHYILTSLSRRREVKRFST